MLGFVGTDAQGLAGLELRFDREIRGQAVRIAVERDARGREFLRTALTESATQGNRIELTLDAEIQSITERELAAGVSNARAAAGAAMVVDPETGEVLALANFPSYAPGDRKNLTGAQLRNRALTDTFEPGSTMPSGEKYFWQSVIGIVAALYLAFSVSETSNLRVLELFMRRLVLPTRSSGW